MLKNKKDYIDYIMNEVSDEKIEKLFADMSIKINLNKPRSENNA
jgi:hypothetical protein